MKLSDYIDADAPIAHGNEDQKIRFTCHIICDCGNFIYPPDNYCSKCGRPVEPCDPISITKTWGDIKEMMRKELEAEFASSQYQKENAE